MNLRRLQFSTRSLFVLTEIASVISAVVVKWPVALRILLILAAIVFLIAGMFKCAILATSDRRPRFAIVSWTVLAGFFLLFSVSTYRLLFNDDLILIPPVFCIMVCCLITCIAGACRSYSLIGQNSNADDRVG
jgi:hypothetical protein